MGTSGARKGKPAKGEPATAFLRFLSVTPAQGRRVPVTRQPLCANLRVFAGEMPYAGGMPFTPYKSAFSPETLQVLQQAFDMAWSEVGTMHGITLDKKAARDMIALRIIAAWRDEGEHDPEQLKRHALRGFVT